MLYRYIFHINIRIKEFMQLILDFNVRLMLNILCSDTRLGSYNFGSEVDYSTVNKVFAAVLLKTQYIILVIPLLNF